MNWQAAQHFELKAPEGFGAVAPDVLLRTKKHAAAAARAAETLPLTPWRGKGYGLEKGKGPKGKWRSKTDSQRTDAGGGNGKEKGAKGGKREEKKKKKKKE